MFDILKSFNIKIEMSSSLIASKYLLKLFTASSVIKTRSKFDKNAALKNQSVCATHQKLQYVTGSVNSEAFSGRSF